jgi:hypothetical protein
VILFNIEATKGPMRSFVVLDKSFLQGVSPAQLYYYVQHGWVFGIADAFWYEHFRKWDEWRRANLVKLKSIENSLVLLPGIGEMFRAEAHEHKPAAQVLVGKRVILNPKLRRGGHFFELDGQTKETANGRTVELEERIDDMIAIWRDFKTLPALNDATHSEMPSRVHELSLQIRDDREDIRRFYGNHRIPPWPQAELIDEQWTFFRWIQVQLIAGLDFFASYGIKTQPSREKLMHELLDLEYLILALVVGGLASREKRMIQRFKLLRPDGILLR